MPSVINMLTNVQTAEVSLVRRGANNKRFALTKSKDQNMPFQKLLAQVLATPAEGEAELITTLKTAGASEEAIEVGVANFRVQAGFADVISKEEFATVAKAAGFDVTKAKKKEEEEEDEDKFPFKSKKKKAEKSHTPADMPVELQKAFDDQAAENEVVRKEAAEAKAEVVALRKEGELRDFITKCKENYSHVPGQSVEEMGAMLQSAYEVSKDFGAKLEKQWGETSQAIEKSALLATQGSAHSTHGGSSAWGQMETIAKELKTADAKLSQGDAMAKAIELNPGLYEQYLAENPAQTGGR